MILTDIRDEGTPGCSFGYYDTFDLLITIKEKKSLLMIHYNVHVQKQIHRSH